MTHKKRQPAVLNIERTLGDKYPNVFGSGPRVVTGPIFAALRMLFHEREVNRFLDEHQDVRGFAFLEAVLDHFQFSYQVSSKDKENIPAKGRVVIVANHPLGALDALSLIQLVSEVRRDVKVVANDLLMHLEPLSDLFLPVDNLNGATQKEQIKAIHDALANEQAVIIFPAGEVSRLKPNGVRDGAWNPGFLRFANRAAAPVLPVYIKARNSSLFYGMSFVYKPLSAMLLVQEMFMQRARTIQMRIGAMIPNDVLQRSGVNRKALSKMVKRHLYRVGGRKPGVFSTVQAIAHPQPRQLIKAELKEALLLGNTKDDKAIYLFDYRPDSAVMKEIGRLREYSFRKVGEGTGDRLDIDRYDRDYRHLVLWDNDQLEIVGSYRIGEARNILEKRGIDGLYTHSLFDLSGDFERCLDNALELGRSFVQPAYWGSRALDYLWQGLGAYVRHFPETQHLYGPVSISQSIPKDARDMLVYYYSTHYGPGCGLTPSKDDDGEQIHVEARIPYQLSEMTCRECAQIIKGDDLVADFKALKSYLQEFGHTVPTLYKQYTDVCEQEGIHFLAFNVDPDFSNVVDGLICADLNYLKPAKRKRYVGDETDASANAE